VTCTEGLLWAASVWAVWLAYAAIDVPTLLGRAVRLLRQAHVPHWVQHGRHSRHP
jgi:hypothetical protein